MPREFIDLNSPSVVAVNCDNKKTMGREKWLRTRLENQQEKDNIEFRKKKNDKIEIKFEIK